MKLVQCHIDNFGKISNLTLDFTGGLNEINEPNAWGKSTLAAFLKAMFYGFDSKKEAKAVAKDRDLYRPWQGGTFGGELTFEVNGKCYKITRTFGKSDKGDEFHLYDLSTNLESRDYTSNIGVELFDLDGASFKRSIFIAQNDCISETSDAINAKLGNLVENTNDINNFETAIGILNDTMNRLSPNRVTGSIKRRKTQITGLEQKIKGFASAKEAGMVLEEKLQAKQKQKNELLEYREGYAKALKMASEESARKELKNRYDQLLQDMNEKKQQVMTYQTLFEAGVPEEKEFVAVQEQVRKIEENRTIIHNFELSKEEETQREKLLGMFDRAVPTEQQIDAQLDNLNKIAKAKSDIADLEAQIQTIHLTLERQELDYRPGKTGGILPLIVCGIFIIAGLALAAGGFFLFSYPLLQIAGGVVALIAGILLVLSLVKDNKVKSRKEAFEEEQQKYAKPVEDLQERMTSLKQSVDQRMGEVLKYLENFHIFCAPDNIQMKLYELKNLLQQYHRYEAVLEKIAIAQEQMEAAKRVLKEFARTYQFHFENDIREELAELQTKATEYRLSIRNYELSKKKVEEFLEKNDPNQLKEVGTCPYSLDELNTMIHDIDQKVEEIRREIEQVNSQLEDLHKQLEQKEDLEQELEANYQLQEKETVKYELLRLTTEFLQSSKEQFTARYMAPISQGFQKYYELLTNQMDMEWQVDANIEVKVKEHGQLREAKYMSAGYKDLLGICMRLALVDAMYKEEKPFLLLDDPFVNLDDSKLRQGKMLLQRLAEEYQTIYFTCHESRSVE